MATTADKPVQVQPREYAPEFVERVKALAATPPAKSMSGDEAVAHYARLLGKGANAR